MDPACFQGLSALYLEIWLEHAFEPLLNVALNVNALRPYVEGIDPTLAVARARERSASRVGRKRARDDEGDADMDAGEDGGEDGPRAHSSKSRSVSAGRLTRRHFGELWGVLGCFG